MRKTSVVLALALIFALPLMALGQETPLTGNAPPTSLPPAAVGGAPGAMPPGEAGAAMIGNVFGGPFAANDIIGQKVRASSGEEVATVTDLLMDENGTVRQVVLDVGGLLGLGSKPVALDVRRLQRQEGDQAGFVVPMTREELTNLPSYQEIGRP